MIHADDKRSEKIAEPTPGPLVATSLYRPKSIRFALLASLLYLAVSYVVVGFKGDQLVLIFLCNALYFASWPTRKLITGFSVFVVYWILFDYMKAFPNYRFNTVHIASLYHAEKSLFGFSSHGAVLTPNEYFALHPTTFLDVVTGLFYLCWVPVPLLFAGILFFRDRRLFFHFALTFFLVNLIGFAGYYLYPAAPPWYVARQGFAFVADTPGNTAGLGRFDAFFGAPIFAGIYSKSSNVFAAMPSLHAAYMLIVVYFGIRSRMRWYIGVFALIMVGIWFTAVYSSHHYILDVLAGILCAILGIFLFRYFAGHTATGKRLVDRLVTVTS